RRAAPPHRRAAAPLLPEHLRPHDGHRPPRRCAGRPSGGDNVALAIEEFAQGWVLWVAAGLALAAAGAGVWIGLRSRSTDANESSTLVSRAARVRELPGYRLAVRRQRVLL